MSHSCKQKRKEREREKSDRKHGLIEGLSELLLKQIFAVRNNVDAKEQTSPVKSI